MLVTVLKGLSTNQQVECSNLHLGSLQSFSSFRRYIVPLMQSGHLLEIYVGLQEVLVIILNAHNSGSLLAVTGNKDLTDKNQKYLKAFIVNEL